MKKIYEQPVVEITAFDVEDIMTTSVVSISTLEAEGQDALLAAVESANSGTTVTKATVYNNSFGW